MIHNVIHSSKVSQSNTSEDDDFNRDPWTYMHQDFLKSKYTVVWIIITHINTLYKHKFRTLCSGLAFVICSCFYIIIVLCKVYDGSFHSAIGKSKVKSADYCSAYLCFFVAWSELKSFYMYLYLFSIRTCNLYFCIVFSVQIVCKPNWY